MEEAQHWSLFGPLDPSSCGNFGVAAAAAPGALGTFFTELQVRQHSGFSVSSDSRQTRLSQTQLSTFPRGELSMAQLEGAACLSDTVIYEGNCFCARLITVL